MKTSSHVQEVRGVFTQCSHKMKKQQYSLGFTLIELLVVISIIGILAALSTVSFTSTQKQARDTKRESDIKQYQNVLENYANSNNGLYPRYSTSIGTTTLCSSLGLSDCPEDPKNSTDTSFAYHYQSDGTGNDGTASAAKYVLWAKLENTASTYWVVCSTGVTGKISSSTSFSGGECPSGIAQ